MKDKPGLSLADHRLLDLVWDRQPIPSPALCRAAEEKLGWKRTTTYTVIKRLCDKGFLKNEATIVSALVDREAVRRAEGAAVLDRSFGGSLPSFLAAFLGTERMSDRDAAEIRRMLDEYRRGHDPKP